MNSSISADHSISEDTSSSKSLEPLVELSKCKEELTKIKNNITTLLYTKTWDAAIPLINIDFIMLFQSIYDNEKDEEEVEGQAEEEVQEEVEEEVDEEA